MIISNRLSKIEQTVDTRLRALMTPDDELIRRGVIVRRVLEYLGLPHTADDGLAGRRQMAIRQAQIMLSTGCQRRIAIVKQYAETHGLTDDAADDWLRRLAETGRIVRGDIDSGKPFCDSEAGARLRVMLERGAKAALEA